MLKDIFFNLCTGEITRNKLKSISLIQPKKINQLNRLFLLDVDSYLNTMITGSEPTYCVSFEIRIDLLNI